MIPEKFGGLSKRLLLRVTFWSFLTTRELCCGYGSNKGCMYAILGAEVHAEPKKQAGIKRMSADEDQAVLLECSTPGLHGDVIGCFVAALAHHNRESPRRVGRPRAAHTKAQGSVQGILLTCLFLHFRLVVLLPSILMSLASMP